MDVLCRIAPGRSREVWLTEISTTGCQVRFRKGLLAERQYVVIKPQGIEGLSGAVRWVLGEMAGIQFERPIHEAVLRLLLYEPAPRPAPRDNGFVDRFGRRLPDRPSDLARLNGRCRPCM